ncbi:phenylalanine--tRNA ligase subunit beta [Candidatus Dependentiae bacterium]|nr:phenylalanine--tRNA ligase subunit beta [Candidatus Dependentiae bacterium]
MKLSLSWIFDHLKGSWADYDIQELVRRFNTTTAEIEQVEHITLNTDHFTLGTVLKIDKEKIILFSSELDKELVLPSRTDAAVGGVFLVFHNKNDHRWATLADWHAAKEGLIGALSATEKELEGSWKDSFESEDYILHLDNKSVTHRPDLWGHRGIAREISAILKIKMRPESEIIKKFPVERHESIASSSKERPFSLKIKNPELIKQLGGGSISSISYCPSLIWMAHRLARIDSKPIDAIVDTTNYVMFDIGQPMHAFDAAKIDVKKIEAGCAGREQTLELLDRQTITVDPEDLVISDGAKPLGLAGVMGGASSAVNASTKSIFIEAGCFDAGRVRKTALRVKKRTEASSRFEKSLDPDNVIKALGRFLTLLSENKIEFKLAGPLALLGHAVGQEELKISHDFITSRLGADVPAAEIKKILEALDFGVETKKNVYHLSVPTFRTSKESFVKEDVVEEIGRFFGYNTIPLEMPALKLKPSSLSATFQERNLKNFCAYSLSAHEVTNYAIFDEEFLRQLKWQPAQTVTIQNPVSENWQAMVTSLVPHLIKNVMQNKTERELRFFEYNNVWHKSGTQVIEKKNIAGIIFAKSSLDFYVLKNQLSKLFTMLNIAAEWKEASTTEPWMHPYQTARIEVAGANLGYAGMANSTFLANVVEGSAFIFELDVQELTKHAATDKQRFTQLAKYPSTWFDISMMIARTISVEQIKKTILSADGRIYKVELVDFYEKDEWQDQRSVTVRFFARDAEKTLSQQEIDHLYDHVLMKLKNNGAVIR